MGRVENKVAIVTGAGVQFAQSIAHIQYCRRLSVKSFIVVCMPGDWNTGLVVHRFWTM